ncbi:MAG: DUF6232 family protein [Limnohabitans sp.]|nr:DUF6232 family protein [Limnohabitans sp.]
METNEQQEKTFYQDSNVTVTQSRYIAGSKTYAMLNISLVSIFKIDKSRTGAILLLVVGILLLFKEETRIIGGIWLFSIKDEYAVRISTNDGEANSLGSKVQAYIQKIVNTLNDAVIHRG